jgi:hypothetical protein
MINVTVSAHEDTLFTKTNIPCQGSDATESGEKM